jgi:hypothetical protein
VNGASRFEDISAVTELRVPNRAGFFTGLNPREFWVFPEVFRHELCSGFDQKTVAKVLIKNGLLVPPPNEKNRNTQKKSINGLGEARVYVLRY